MRTSCLRATQFVAVFAAFSGASIPLAQAADPTPESILSLRKEYLGLLDPLSYVQIPAPIATRFWLGAHRAPPKFSPQKAAAWLEQYRTKLSEQIEPIENVTQSLLKRDSDLRTKASQPVPQDVQRFRAHGIIEVSTESRGPRPGVHEMSREEVMASTEVLFQLAVAEQRGPEIDLIDSVRLLFRTLGQPYVLIDQGFQLREKNRVIGIQPIHFVFQVGSADRVELYPLAALLDRVRELEAEELSLEGVRQKESWNQMDKRLEEARLRALEQLKADLAKVTQSSTQGYRRTLIITALKQAIARAELQRVRVKKDGQLTETQHGKFEFVFETTDAQGKVLNTWSVPCDRLLKATGD